MQKSIFSLIISLLFSFQLVIAQQAIDFDVVDTGGQRHKLYEDYLDQGKTVVIKLFFVNCPPCNNIAPHMQELNEKWGDGDYDVEFFEITTQNGDDNADVQGYKNRHGITFPGISADGGAASAVAPFRNGTYGPFYGTPSFAVIAPDGTVNNGIQGFGIEGRINAIDEAIAATGAQGNGSNNPEPSVFNFDIKSAFNESISNVELTLESEDGSVSYDLDATKELSIEDLATEYPNISDPYIRIKKTDDVNDNISALDLFVIVRHILDKELITDDNIKLAADSNGDGSISALDLFTIQRIILGLDLQFPNSDSYEFVPNELQITLDPGNTQNLNFTAIKIGDVNGI